MPTTTKNSFLVMSTHSLTSLTMEKARKMADLGQLALEQTKGMLISDEVLAQIKKLDSEIEALEQKIRELTIATILAKHGIKGVPRFPPPPPDNGGAGPAKRAKPE